MKALLFANTDWYLYNFWLPLAKAIRDMGFDVVLVSPPGNYGGRLEAEGFRWVPISMSRRSLNPWVEARLIAEITSLYRRERPDIVHHFTIKPVVYGSLAARLAGVLHVVNSVTGLGHVFSNRGIRMRLLRPVIYLLLRFALNARKGPLILQNVDDRDLFLKHGLIGSGRIRLIRGAGVNTSKFIPVSANGNGRPECVKVLLAARLLWDKGVGEYVKAARQVQNKTDSVEFMIAGSNDDGNPASIADEYINRWAGEGVIIPLGQVDDMPDLLSRVDIVVLPTSYREGLPTILIEAASCGLPVVATDVSGCRDIVEHNVNGLLIPERDSDSLAKAILQLASNPEERKRMGLAGRRKVLEEFDEKIVIRETLGVYREMLSLPGPAGEDRLTQSENSSGLAEAMKKLIRGA